MNTSPIRLATANDVSAFKSIIDRTDMFPSEWIDDMIHPYLAKEKEAEEFWITYADNTVRALAYIAPERMTEGTWNLLLIAVDPASQGQGIGGTLMRYIEDRLTALGGRLLIVETSGLPEFDRTREFYCKCKYKEEARIREFYDAGEDKIVFWKLL